MLQLLPWFGHLMGLHRDRIEHLTYSDFAAYRGWITEHLNGGEDG